LLLKTAGNIISDGSFQLQKGQFISLSLDLTVANMLISQIQFR